MLFSVQNEEELVKKKIRQLTGKECDKYDYMIAASCGAIAGIIDVYFVNKPNIYKANEGFKKNSGLHSFTSKEIDKLVEKISKKAGWNGNNGISGAIKFLEDKYRVNYDHPFGKAASSLLNMSTNNHHLKSLAHSPDIIGLIFSLIDQFTNTAHFIDNGRLITVDSESKLQGSNFISKLYAGTVNWIMHIISDMAGSNQSRANEGHIGSGVPIPFYNLFLLCDFGKLPIKNGNNNEMMTIADTAVKVFEQGYDLRFGLAMSIPVLINELLVRILWVLKQRFYHKKEWLQCIPNDDHKDLRMMLITSYGTFCAIDGIDALVRGKGDLLDTLLHMNLIAWWKLVSLSFKELTIRFGFTYHDLRIAYTIVNKELDDLLTIMKKVDYRRYQEEHQNLVKLLYYVESDSENIDSIYDFLVSKGVTVQFKNFKEFDEAMMDDDFELII